MSLKHQSSLPLKFLELAKAAQSKFSNHLWYLTERNVVFLFFSNKVTLKEKTEMWKQMQKLKSNAVEETVSQGLVQIPEISENTGYLKDLIGADSFAFSWANAFRWMFFKWPTKNVGWGWKL